MRFQRSFDLGERWNMTPWFGSYLHSVLKTTWYQVSLRFVHHHEFALKRPYDRLRGILQMVDWKLQAPVAFFVFNRPDTTRLVFDEIAKARPKILLLIADGPRQSRVDEAEKCALVRSIVTKVDWPCKVLTNFSDSNLGCRVRISSGLDWVFEQVEEAIVLEDDCLPHPTFFRFCDEMLARYRSDGRVGMISGDNFQNGQRAGTGSYYFSKYPHIWGWATWRRAWRLYDVNARTWPEFSHSGAFQRKTLRCERETWYKAFDGVYRGEIDTWDYQWTLSCWVQSMLSVLPQVNLIENIGFGPEATHTTSASPLANMPVGAMSWPLVEPVTVDADDIADRRTAEALFSKSVRQRAKSKVAWVIQVLMRRLRGKQIM